MLKICPRDSDTKAQKCFFTTGVMMEATKHFKNCLIFLAHGSQNPEGRISKKKKNGINFSKKSQKTCASV